MTEDNLDNCHVNSRINFTKADNMGLYKNYNFTAAANSNRKENCTEISCLGMKVLVVDVVGHTMLILPSLQSLEPCCTHAERDSCSKTQSL